MFAKKRCKVTKIFCNRNTTSRKNSQKNKIIAQNKFGFKPQMYNSNVNPTFMMRQTNYLEKIDATWKVLHEHTLAAAN